MVAVQHTFLLSLILLRISNHLVKSTRDLETLPRSTTGYHLMFTHNINDRRKEVIYDTYMAREMVDCEKPKGLHRTLVDLHFPEPLTQTTVYRVVQFLLHGGVTDLQRDLYTTVELELEGVKSKKEKERNCHDDIVVKLTKPSQFEANAFFVPVKDGAEKVVRLEKHAKTTVKFENVFDDDLPMDHFWVNLTVHGRCNYYLDVNLVKPSNTDETL